jgi:hypothetical protein
MNLDSLPALAAAACLVGGCYLAIFQDDIKARRKAKQAAKEAKHAQCIEPITKPRPPVTPKPIQAPVEKPTKPKRATISPETIEAMHKQADAERAIAEALEHKAQYITDPVKRARIEKQAALSWTRFNKILDNIDKVTAEN